MSIARRFAISGLLTSLLLSSGLLTPPVWAAEQLVITYGPLSAGLAVQDLAARVN
jgi:hypothetical protein